MDPNFHKDIKNTIDLIYEKIQKSRNKLLIKKLDERKEQIYASIPQEQSIILSNNQNREFIAKYLDKFMKFAIDSDNLIDQGFFFGLIRNSERIKLQNVFAKKFTQLPQYFKNLEVQDMSATGFINNQDSAHCKVPVNFTASSYLLDNEIDLIVCITLIFKDIFDEEIFVHSLGTEKLLKKIPELKQFEFLKTFPNYLSITVDKSQKIVTLESLNPIIHFSPLIIQNQNENQQQQEFYLSNDMEIILTPTYKLKVLKVFNKQNNPLNQNFISKSLKNQLDDNLFINNVENQIILQPLEQNLKHHPISILNLKKSILLNKFLGLPKEISVQLIYDGIGFLFRVLNESNNFYISLSLQSPFHAQTKKINICLVIKNMLRLQIDSECGQLFFDSTEYNRNLFE